MFLTGFTVGAFKLGELLRSARIYLLCLLRMLLFPILLTALLLLTGADSRTLTFGLIAHAMPLGLFPVVYPAAWGADTRPGAAGALISNLLSTVTVPLLYALLVWTLRTLGMVPFAG